jgi:hypothetical protein
MQCIPNAADRVAEKEAMAAAATGVVTRNTSASTASNPNNSTDPDPVEKEAPAEQPLLAALTEKVRSTASTSLQQFD